jgi:hypothetical protein
MVRMSIRFSTENSIIELREAWICLRGCSVNNVHKLTLLGWADKEWSSTNHKYNKNKPSSRLSKGIAKYFLGFEMSLGSNSEVLILMKLKIQISRHY